MCNCMCHEPGRQQDAKECCWEMHDTKALQQKLETANAEVARLNAEAKRIFDAGLDKIEGLELQNRDLLDFIACVRIWADGQPTGKSIRDSCGQLLDKYTQKRFPEALKQANEQYGETFKRLAQDTGASNPGGQIS